MGEWLFDFKLFNWPNQTSPTTTEVIEFFLAVQVVILCLLFVLAAAKRLRRLWTRRSDPYWQKRFEKLWLQYLYPETPDDRPLALAELRQAIRSPGRYGFLRRILQEQLKVFKDHEHQLLNRLYKECGFFSDDLSDLNSLWWSKRLAAVLRLERLEDPELEGAFRKMLKDKNDLVVLVSIRAYSKVTNEVEPLLDALSRKAPARRDLFTEILMNLADRDPSRVIRYLFECFDPFVASLCIEVLGRKKVQSALPVILSLAESGDEGVAEACSEALGEIGETSAIPSLRKLLTHPNSMIQAKALVSLYRLGERNLHTQLKGLETDQDFGVRREIFNLKLQLQIGVDA
ncbi:MAG: hypothetical protein EA369_00840 [Bradymonadales bacterium]|nr:MAG: hypothetical protein EA369_00840 [Bradymonadales bacterium]